MKIDVGCGSKKRGQDYIGVDIYPYPGVNIVHDVETGLPFKDNEIDEIYTSHFLEHTKDFVSTMEEFYRVLKPGGILEVIVPHWATCVAHTEFHLRFFRFHSFDEFDTKYNKSFKTSEKAKFKILERKFSYKHNPLISPYSIAMEFISNIFPTRFDNWLSRFLPPTEIYFKMEAVK